ncbi:MAG: peptide ABC transporter substrate-binding protein [Thermomicrobiales bacterium]|nr:peptide ABC transporter substrate-binding protein [Thermomicrobiales bacterium]MCO5219212.1 peptide ABC transporter substrate-binding protein [Thermomicrobiales bacterium]MCO5225069.1 peptide ABC transporter substrate-binding protein [Thermomicrobiales bacterium]MCO5228121.1 peptide ABC transporter substrate-binding protein [Thermomicrobiales bacterium]
MSQTKTTGPLRELFDSYKSGKISRRSFAQGATALGVALPLVSFLGNQVSAQDAAPAERPTSGTEGQERGAGGHLNIIQWQAVTRLSPHTSSGTKDFLGSLPMLEPLIHYLPDSSMVPNLVTKVPSQADGDLAEDLTSVTLSLLPDVLWSDGTPFTSADVGFTIDWVKDPMNNSVNFGDYEPISGWEAADDLTITVTFSSPNPFWFTPFTGTSTGFVYPKHILEVEGAHEQFLLNPVGTGPFVVDSFTPNDELRLIANENYREPNKPFFATVTIKGGGDAAAAARATLQSGESDFAWNLVVEPDVLDSMESPDNPGVLLPYAGVQVERVNINFSDPNTEVDGQRSEMNTPHPFWSDPAVREAASMAIDRETIATNFYGPTQPPAVNILNGDPRTDSPNTVFNFDRDAANALLEEAGWVDSGNGIRAKDGVELKLEFATSVNPVRQKSQAVIKDGLEKIGFQVNLVQIDSGIYFDTGEGNDQSIYHNYWDMNMYTGVPSSPRPIGFFEAWYAGENGANIAQASNKWLGNNNQRYNNPEFDELWVATRTETDPEQLADNFIGLNDIVINDRVIIPLVVVGAARGVSKRLNAENIALAPFSYDYWNIANWNLAAE